MPEDLETCANCGSTLSGRGRKPEGGGPRFCSGKASCRAAYQRHRYAQQRGEREPVFCGFCGDEIQGGLRSDRDPDEPVFCSSKTSCRIAKRRHRRGLGEAVIEDRPCSHCGAELPARVRRKTDLDLGRWCVDKAACRRARQTAIELDVPPEVRLERARIWYRAFTEQRDRMQAATVVACDRCGRENARDGFDHPLPGVKGYSTDPDDWCYGTGTEHVIRPVADPDADVAL